MKMQMHDGVQDTNRAASGAALVETNQKKLQQYKFMSYNVQNALPDLVIFGVVVSSSLGVA